VTPTPDPAGVALELARALEAAGIHVFVPGRIADRLGL